MIRVDPRARVMIAIEPADFRRGIDGLARLCEENLQANPRSGAVFVFRAESADAVEKFVTADPYVAAGLVTGWRVRPWNVVIGGE